MSAFFGHNIAGGSGGGGGGDGINPKPNKKLSLGAGSYVTIAWKGFSHSSKFFCPPLHVQTDATLLANNSQHCWMLHVAFVCTPCYMLLDVVAQSLKPVKRFSQQLPTFLLLPDRRDVAQQCWIRWHSSSNTWFTKAYRLFFPHDTLQVSTLLGVVASVSTPMPTRAQRLPTLLAQQCSEFFPFAPNFTSKFSEINF